MGLIRLRSRVKDISEEQWEARQTYDLGNISSDVRWTWAEKGFRSQDIYDITAFSGAKTLVTLLDDTTVLAIEPFAQVFEKWKKAEAEDSLHDLLAEETPEETPQEDFPDEDPEE